MVLKDYSGRYLIVYIPEKFKTERLKLRINSKKDKSFDHLKLQDRDGIESIIIRELIKRYNKHFEEKNKENIEPSELQIPESEEEKEEENETNES